MQTKYGLISADDHVLESPDLWTARLSQTRWGERIPHVARMSDGSEAWIVDGRGIALTGFATANAALPDNNGAAKRWAEVHAMVYDAGERLRAMDRDGVDYSILYPSVSGLAGETFGRLADADLELACVQAYNDWLIEEWARVSPRLVPQ